MLIDRIAGAIARLRHLKCLDAHHTQGVLYGHPNLAWRESARDSVRNSQIESCHPPFAEPDQKNRSQQDLVLKHRAFEPSANLFLVPPKFIGQELLTNVSANPLG
jgi:hypothetical protein